LCDKENAPEDRPNPSNKKQCSHKLQQANPEIGTQRRKPRAATRAGITARAQNAKASNDGTNARQEDVDDEKND